MVRRSRWFRLNGSKGEAEPYGPKMNMRLNAAYEKLQAAQDRVLHLISWFLDDDDGVDANLQNACGHTSSLGYCTRVELKRFQHWQNIKLYFDFLVYSTLRKETNTFVEVHDVSHSGCSQHLNFKYDSIGHVIKLGHQRNWQESADGSPDSSRSPGTSPSAKCEIVRCGTPAVTSVAHTPRIESSWKEGCSRIPKVCKRLI